MGGTVTLRAQARAQALSWARTRALAQGFRLRIQGELDEEYVEELRVRGAHERP